jgi:hypothetical protein
VKPDIERRQIFLLTWMAWLIGERFTFVEFRYMVHSVEFICKVVLTHFCIAAFQQYVYCSDHFLINIIFSYNKKIKTRHYILFYQK